MTTIFNQLLDEIMTLYHIDNDLISKEIDRSSSRIRHWRNDSKPGKKIINLFLNSICRHIQDYDCEFTNKKCLLEIDKLIATDVTLNEKLQEISFIESHSRYIRLVLEEAYNTSTGRKKTKKTVSHNLKIESEIRLALTEAKNGYYEEAIETLEKLLKICGDNKTNLDKVYRELSIIYRDSGNLEGDIKKLNTSLSYIVRTINIDASLHDQAISYKLLGTIYQSKARMQDSIKNMEMALDAYSNAKQMIDSEKNKLEYLKIINNLGVLYLELAQFKKTKLNLEKSIELFTIIVQEEISQSDEFLYNRSLSNAIAAHYRMITISESSYHFNKAVEYGNIYFHNHTINENPYDYCRFNDNLALVYLAYGTVIENNQYLNQALIYTNKSLEFYQENNYHLSMASIWLSQVSIYENLYKITKSLNYYHLGMSAADKALKIFDDCGDQLSLNKVDFHRLKLEALNHVQKKNINETKKCIESYRELQRYFTKSSSIALFYEIEYEIALSYFNLYELTDVDSYYEKSYQTLKELKDFYSLLSNPYMHNRINNLLTYKRFIKQKKVN
ncbi:tetratricopeptide repeat protein [Acidaminobacter sp. JC074]|uniref:hypothetical protein n=1 Tax=Acidaminobacter sp. JC074 TaxID=2530199 RepID=UPI001F100B85|nr:hypothetical protein [Acidaminobacter sp. JC074]MCH4890288.1 tetratricopeptide repeat protein [Acidaminobacter sp. JC074]